MKWNRLANHFEKKKKKKKQSGKNNTFRVKLSHIEISFVLVFWNSISSFVLCCWKLKTDNTILDIVFMPFYCSTTFILFGFPIFRLWAGLMNIIPETSHVHVFIITTVSILLLLRHCHNLFDIFIIEIYSSWIM